MALTSWRCCRALLTWVTTNAQLAETADLEAFVAGLIKCHILAAGSTAREPKRDRDRSASATAAFHSNKRARSFQDDTGGEYAGGRGGHGRGRGGRHSSRGRGSHDGSGAAAGSAGAAATAGEGGGSGSK